MKKISLEATREWLRSLRGADKVNFAILGMKDMMALVDIPLGVSFLQAAVHHWNPIRHTFVFGSQELCPTVEEFRVISGIEISDIPILPRSRFGYLGELKKLCGGSERENGALIHGSALDVMGLVRKFKDCAHPHDAASIGHRRNALCICVFAGFLLASPMGITSVGLIDVVSQFLDRQDPIPLVLAETIGGLDRIRDGDSAIFGGSPLLLQIWLREHLQIVAFPLERYRPCDFAQRRVEVEFKSEVEWKAWLEGLQADDIEWHPPHWGLGDMTWSVEKKNEVLLVGMDAPIAYYPSYIRRQYGLSATFPTAFTPQPLAAMTRRFLEAYRGKWARRLKRGPEPSFTAQLPDGYAEYMEVEASKVHQRIEDKGEGRKRQREY